MKKKKTKYKKSLSGGKLINDNRLVTNIDLGPVWCYGWLLLLRCEKS